MGKLLKLSVFIALLAGGFTTTPAKVQGTTPAQIGGKPAVSAALPDPMIFFLAKGEPDACGPGCSEWIAAEGLFDPAVEQKFREILGFLKGRKLPIFFNSGGGIIGEARVIGRILRERRMTAGVAETFVEGCDAATAADESCRKIMQSRREGKARLRKAGSRCTSACVFALIGASLRQIPTEARLGIHASALSPASIAAAQQPGALADEQIYSERKRFVLEMGVDPGLVDEAEKTPSYGMHILSREEIAKFGIESQGVYETKWMLFKDRESKPFMLKAITQSSADGKEYRTTNLRVTCDVTRRGLRLEYQREPSSNEIGASTVIRLVGGNRRLLLQRSRQPKRGNDEYDVTTDWDFFRKLPEASNALFVEEFSPRSGARWSREVKLSTTGLTKALDQLKDNCGTQ